MEELVNKALVFDYFAGKVSPFQKKSIEAWLSKSGNRNIYYQWLHEWEGSNLQLTTNWQQAFAQTSQRVIAATQPEPRSVTIPLHGWQQPARRFWLVAASVLFIIGFGGWLIADMVRYQTVKTGYGEIKQYVLPDGSMVDLNANSSIRFPRFGFAENSMLASILGMKDERRVELTGEGDFLVRHLPNHRKFTVLTGKGLTVNVLGTHFTVYARENQTQVVLRSGKVALTLLQKNNQPALTMKPGDLATLDAQGKLAIRQTAHPENLSAWKQHRFSFETTSLREIAQLLEDNYGLTVKIEGDGLANRTISGSFPAQDANEVIKLVAELLQINYFRENNNVTFSN